MISFFMLIFFSDLRSILGILLFNRLFSPVYRFTSQGSTKIFIFATETGSYAHFFALLLVEHLAFDLTYFHMIKHIPTYGAAILTAMVIVRAATLEDEGDMSRLVQRDQNSNYITENTAFRTDAETDFYNATPLLASLLKSPSETSQPLWKEMPANTLETVITNESLEPSTEALDEEIAELILVDQSLIEEETRLSLDGENTINTRISTLFPRQRIQPKPEPYLIPE